MDLSRSRNDLRTRLNQIGGYSEMLLEDAQDQPEVAQELQEILDGSKRLLSLVSKVLAVDGVSLDLIRGELQAPLDSVMTQAQNLLAKAKHAGLANLLPDLQKIATAAGNLDALLKNTQIETGVHCIEMGADDYLPKPFNPGLLKARIGACLEKKHLRDKERRYLEQLQMEQEKSERLLLNVLPKEIADRLKGGEEAIADHFADVTILFADLVGFTTISQRMSAVDLVNLLNEIFSAFDHLAARHGLEKIKTIGDAYMVAGGLRVSRPGHAESIAEMALDMQQEINRFNEKYNTQIQIRIGINTGPVIAGIIGRNKFIYDLWGDTVNTASRMESHCVADGIQVTEKTRSYLDSKYVFQDRGKIEVKGKGGMQVYLLAGRKGSLE